MAKRWMMDLMELGKTPIPGGSPAGQDVRADVAFEAMTAEIDKLSSPTFSGTIEWNKVVTQGYEILETKSKDLLVIAYLCIALEKNDGLKGLAKGFHILRDALESFWEDMFPAKKRMRGRKNAIEWLIDTLRDHLPSLPQEQWPKTDRDGFFADLNVIDQFLGENMEEAPTMMPLINEILSHVEAEKETIVPTEPVRAPEAEASPRTPSQGPPPPPAPVRQAPSAPAFNPSDTDAGKLLDQGLEILGHVATLLIEQDPLNDLSFRLNRIAAWTSVTTIPTVAGNKTLLPAPDGQIIAVLQNLYQSRNWQDLLQAAESRIRQFLFWLDLNRYVAESLEQLGRQNTANMVVVETLQYIKRLPGIEMLAFEDGTPFANEETRLWLKSRMEMQVDSAENAAAGPGSQERAVGEALAEARKLSRENRINDAIRQLHDGLGRSTTAKERFFWRQGLCRFLMEAKQPRLALPHMHDLLADIETHGIEQWDPLLAAEAFAVVLTGLRLQPEQDQDRQNSILNRLAMVDTVRAIDFL